MTPEEKAERYNELLLKLQKAKVDDNVCDEMYYRVIDDIVPELKESEGERIRKQLLNWFKGCHWDAIDDGTLKRDDIITWLEKQSEQKQGPCDNCKDVMLNCHNFKQGKSVLEVIKEEPQVYKTKDGEIITYSETDGYKVEQKPQGKTELEAINEEKVDNANKVEPKDYSSIDPHFFKPTDKVEPKFKVGDWIIGRATNNEPRQISEITDNYYKSTYGGQYGFSFENEMHLWTIQDAKAGDVIYSKHNTEDFEWIGIFKSLDEGVHFYGFWNNVTKVFKVCNNEIFVLYEDFSPATKEQRDTLMKTMADAGYTFDFDKKELKKIEGEIEIPYGAKDSELIEESYYITKGFHAEIDDDKVVIKKGEKPTAWSEEDKTALGDALWCCKQAASIAKNENDMGNIWHAEKWLKSLEGRIHPKNDYNPYKEVVESIAKMCERYDKYSHSILKDFYNNVKVKCKDAKEFDSLHPQNTKVISQ